LFFDLRDKLGMTFVIVTHDESLADRSDVIVHLSDGRVIDSAEGRVINDNQQEQQTQDEQTQENPTI
jgi:lipoprotein-releasing system ATP-binding protein